MHLNRALITVLAFASHFTLAWATSPAPVWEITKDIKTPESAYFDVGSQHWYISNVAGDPKRTDGVGWISKVDPRGKVIDARWVSGLSAPKGMRSAGGYLWVTDIQNLLKIDIQSGQIVHRVLVASARFLNDIAIAPNGDVYVSDTLTSRIYRYREPQIKIFVQGNDWESPNGLLWRDGKLLVASWGLTSDFSNQTAGHLYSIDVQTKQKELITPKPLGNLDGLEWDGKSYLVSDWVAGKVFRVLPSGESTQLLSGFKGAADIGWMPENRTLVVPRMNEDKVSAFQLAD